MMLAPTSRAVWGRGAATRLLAGAALAAALASAAAAAVEIEQGRIYPGGTRLEAPDLGVAFTVPAGWAGTWPEGSELVVLQPESDPQTTILALLEEASRAELEALMAQPIDLGQGVVLVPSGPLGERGAAVTGRYELGGARGGRVAYAEGLAGEGGLAAGYVLIALPGAIAAHEPALRALVDGTTLGPPAAAAPPGGEPSGEQPAGGGSTAGDRWDAYLAGKYIVRYFTRTGYTDEQHLWLCRDGTFYRKGAAGGFGGGASGAFQADSSGRWSASGAGEHGTLTLRYGDGTSATHELRWDYEENHLYLDGKRWLHGENEVCA